MIKRETHDGSWVKNSLFSAFFLCLFLLGMNSGYAAEITLLWNKNTEADIEGYRVYTGTSSRIYSTSPICQVDSNWNSCIVYVPQDGQTHYYAVTAYNTEGLESGFSNEVIYRPRVFRTFR